MGIHVQGFKRFQHAGQKTTALGKMTLLVLWMFNTLILKRKENLRLCI